MQNERFIALRGGGSFSTLFDYLNRRVVKGSPFDVAQQVAPSTAQFALVPSTILSGTIAVGTSSTNSGGYSAAALPGAVGTAATTKISDSLGNVLNLIMLRDTNGDPILHGSGATAKVVYGLLQCSSGTSDGVSIGGVGSENLQISFVYFDGDTLTLVALNQTLQFQGNKLIIARNMPTIVKEDGNLDPDVIGAPTITPTTRKFVVTTAYAANEVITLSTGNGASAGRSTPSGDTLTLNASDAAMRADNTCRISYNGSMCDKGSGNDFVWDSSTTGHFTFILDVGDKFEMERIV